MDIIYPININSSLPSTYHQLNVEKQILFITDADGYGKCDYPNPIDHECTVSKVGDNHRGYMGFRNSTDPTKLVDGVIDVVARNWNFSH